MDLMICLNGEPEQLPYLPEIAALGAGIELGSYGMAGIRSEQAWAARVAMHQALRRRFAGPLAVHGPFIGMEFAHVDHLLQAAVQRRLDMTLAVAMQLRAGRVVLHSGCSPVYDLFGLQDSWLARNVEFWQREIRRWAAVGVAVVLENDTERSPDLLVGLVDGVGSPWLGLCLDVGHQHLFSALDAPAWVWRMGHRLQHVHVHDNDRARDRHWPLGRGTIDFEPIFATLAAQAPQATLSLEVEDTIEAKMAGLRSLAARFAK